MSTSSVMRQASHTTSSSSNSVPNNPKSRLGFFKKLSASGPSSKIIEGVNREREASIDGTFAASNYHLSSASDKIAASPSYINLEQSRAGNGLPSPDSFISANYDTEFLHLRENIRRLRKAPPGPDPKKVDAVWEVYKKLREDSLQLCKNLIQKSQNHDRNASLQSNDIGPLDTRSSNSGGSMTETALSFHVNDQWLAAINEYKITQEAMLENLRTSLLTTYKSYEPDATKRQMDAFLSDKTLRKNLMVKWRDASVHRMRSEKLLFWEQYKIRSLNYDRLRLDLQAIKELFTEAEEGKSTNMAIKEHVVARNGDTILEFANAASQIFPILRFRVSSHLMAEASPFFAYFLAPKKAIDNASLDFAKQLPPAPTRHTCNDGMEVNVYKMPQVELNENNSLGILLHAAHMQHPKVPRQIDFPVFVSIAEVCLRYQCTGPLELQVEYQWLPQWVHLVGDENIDGFLLISYAFGLRRIFTRMSKTAILTSLGDEEIDSKHRWPRAVRERIKATRTAKIAQIYECCKNAISEYFRTPSISTERKTAVGSLQLTSLPRCPRGSHLCDATNLGWIMLVFNELNVLPTIFQDSGFHGLPKPPKRSLKELVDCLRLVPSAPQVHNGVCDYSAAFRSDINDIYNSVVGLTLRDVTGRDGWALSKHAGPTENRYDDLARDLVELEAPMAMSVQSRSAIALSNESINLRILSHIDNMEDLMSAALIHKSFYNAFKLNEATLLKNVMRAERKRTWKVMSESNLRGASSSMLRRSVVRPGRLKRVSFEEKSLHSDKLRIPRPAPSESSGEELDDDGSSDSDSEAESEDAMTEEEAHRILWPNDETTPTSLQPNPYPADGNEKCLVGDLAHVEDKARMMGDDKNLRDEKDKALGLGARKK